MLNYTVLSKRSYSCNTCIEGTFDVVIDALVFPTSRNRFFIEHLFVLLMFSRIVSVFPAVCFAFPFWVFLVPFFPWSFFSFLVLSYFFCSLLFVISFFSFFVDVISVLYSVMQHHLVYVFSPSMFLS